VLQNRFLAYHGEREALVGVGRGCRVSLRILCRGEAQEVVVLVEQATT